MNNENVNTKVVIKARFSYVHVWEPKAIQEGGDKKYSVSLLIPKTDTEVIDKVKKAIAAAFVGLTAKMGGKKPAKWKNPLRDGDEDRPEDENYVGHYFVNASCKTKPGVVGVDKKPITDQDDFYSGCYGFASVNFFPFSVSGSNGVACGLNNVMKTKDGESLGGRSTAESDFADIEVPFEAPTEDDEVF